ncbi:MAG: Non-canonical purine NTP pyrophosphatase [candidate division WS2 bacterium]|nr:Non-canonical purine NTP pyrophosphatase [Candidatus Psychracetigena formicireducens]
MTYNSLLIATSNPGKLTEINYLLKELLINPYQKANLKILSYQDFPPVEEIEESSISYQENAVKKALLSAKRFNLPSLADDSGLEVEALGGKPGVNSRYFGGEISFKEKRELLLKLLSGVPFTDRIARFVCVAVLALPRGELFISRGEVYGYINQEERGETGFGYDPIFYYPQLNHTFGELEDWEKNQISHRAKALEALIPKILPLF